MSEISRSTCYVICPLSDKDSAVRRRSDQVLKHLIRPAVEKFDYDVRRSDMDADPGEIPAQIIRQMAGAELVVADLTDSNPNVFYELAIRHVAAKPLVQLISAGQTIPFDVGHMRTVHFNLADPDDLVAARVELEKHVEALQGVEEMETPVKASLRLKEALESPDPTTAGTAEVLAEIQAMRSEVERLRLSQRAGEEPWRKALQQVLLTGETLTPIAGGLPRKDLESLLTRAQGGGGPDFPAPQEDPGAGSRKASGKQRTKGSPPQQKRMAP